MLSKYNIIAGVIILVSGMVILKLKHWLDVEWIIILIATVGILFMASMMYIFDEMEGKANG
jgi:hypothetical protein